MYNNSFKLSLLLIASVFFVINSVSAIEPPEQDFDDIDRMLEQQFRQKTADIDSLYQAYEKAISDAFQGVTKKIKVQWPNNIKLPTKSTWVGYEPDLKTRSIVNFNEGKLIIETKVENNNFKKAKNKINTMVVKLSDPTTESIEKLDILSHALKDRLKSEGIHSKVSIQPKNNILKKILPKPELLNVNSTNINNISSIAKTNVVETEPQVMLELIEKNDNTVLKMTVKFVNHYQEVLLANNFKDVKKFSAKYDVPISVILAIIETESSYNPRAISQVPAFGLMQLVPKTAGVDAHNYVHGKKKVVSPEFLFDETNNLQLGTAYFKLLKSRYLRKIKDSRSRFYCAVSSYNTGVGNLARTFTGQKSLSQAVKKINSMTSEQVYQFLLKHLPAEETKKYLEKIVSRRAKYQHFDNQTKEV